MTEIPATYGTPPRTPAEKLRDALRNGWWIVAGTAALVFLATLVVLFRVTPLYEAEGALRIEAERPGFRGLEALPGFELVMGGGMAGVPTEIAVLRSRTLALEADGELGVRARVARPRGVPRSVLFHELRAERGMPEGEFRFVLDGDAYAVEARHREPPEIWRPFRGGEWVTVDSARVEPGQTFRVGGLTGRLRDDAAARAPEIKVEVPPEDAFLDHYDRRLTVERPERDADVVEIRFQDPDPALARDVVNLLQQRYMEDRREHRAREPRATAELLTDQLGGLRSELARAEEELREFRETRRVILPEIEAEEEIVRLAEIMGERDMLEAERRALAEVMDEIRVEAANSDDGAPSPWRRLMAFPTLLRTGTTGELLHTLNELENQRSGLLETRTLEDLRVRLVSERIRAVEAQLRDVAETYLDGLQRQIASLDRTLDGYRGELDRIPRAEMEFIRHRRHVELLSDVVGVLEVRQREAEIRALVEDASVQVVDAPRLPREPVRPRPLISLALALMVGLVLGTAGALVREGV